MNLYEVLTQNGLTDAEAQDAIISLADENTDLTLLDSAVERYNHLTREIKDRTEELDATKTALLALMEMLNLSAYACRYGKVNVIAQAERITYPKNELDSIAKQNKALRKILDSVAKIGVVKKHIRINPVAEEQNRD